MQIVVLRILVLWLQHQLVMIDGIHTPIFYRVYSIALGQSHVKRKICSVTMYIPWTIWVKCTILKLHQTQQIKNNVHDV